MAARGRRRLSLPTFIVLFVCVFAATSSAFSGVIGIDFGTEYLKAVLVKPGIPLEIVLTKDSKRKEVAAVAFKPGTSQVDDPNSYPERLYGGDALAIAARFPGDVYSHLKPLLGMPFESEIREAYVKKYPGLALINDETTGSVSFKSGAVGGSHTPFLVEEILAMELKNLKKNAETMAGQGSSLQNVVITIPIFYTAEEKRAIELAADLAGLNVLALITDGLAVGLNYATSRTFPDVSNGEKPEYNLIYDMGAGSTTATIIRFQGRTVKDVGKFNKTIQEVQVLGAGWDRTLGGDSLNSIIVDDIVNKFVESDQITRLGVSREVIKKHPKTMAKLWKESQRIRQILSANSEAHSSFEGLYKDDVYFKYKLTRSDFEKLASAMDVSAPITQALEAAQLSLSELDSIILHGGASRTPFVQRGLEAVVKDPKKIRSNVNADEAAVFGAAFEAAAISPSFRVKEIRISDIAGYAVGLQWEHEGKVRRQKLFTPTSQVNAEKRVPFKNLEDFTFQLYQLLPADNDFTDAPILDIKTTNLTKTVSELKEKYSCESANITTNFAIRLGSTNALPEIISGSVTCEVLNEAKKGNMVDNVKGFFGLGSKKDAKGQEPLKQETISSDGDSISSESPIGTSTVVSSPSEAIASSSTSTVDSPDVVTKTVQIPVSFTTSSVGRTSTSGKSLSDIKYRLKSFDTSDRERRLRDEAFNSLEAFAYRAREFIHDDDFLAASTPKEQEQIETEFSEATDWLYGEGADATKSVLKDKLKNLESLVNPIRNRVDEARKRPALVKSLQDALESVGTLVDVVKKNLESTTSTTTTPSSSTTQTTAESDDPFASLEDEPSTTTSETTATPSPSLPPLYSPEDLTELTESYERISSWLNAKLEEQQKLSAHDNPVLLSSDIEKRAKELNKMTTDMMQKSINRLRQIEKEKTKKRKSSSSKKGKKNGSTSSSSTSDQASTTTTPTTSTVAASSSSSTAPTPSSQTEHVKDEL